MVDIIRKDDTNLPRLGRWRKTEDHEVNDEYKEGLTYNQPQQDCLYAGLFIMDGSGTSHGDTYTIKFFGAVYRDGNGEQVDDTDEGWLYVTYHEWYTEEPNYKSEIGMPHYFAETCFINDERYDSIDNIQEFIDE